MRIFNYYLIFSWLSWQFMMAMEVDGMVEYNGERNISVVAKALAGIINALNPQQLAILEMPASNDSLPRFFDENMARDVSDFVYQLHKFYFKTVIFNDFDLFMQYIAASLQGSTESVNLLFAPPYELLRHLQENHLAHRLSLFMFYWGARQPPLASDVHFEEPMRAVVITRPRERAFRVYYNQAVPDGISNLRLVNWYDEDNLGMQKTPLLPQAGSVYSNFHGRLLRVPVFHSPPWFWVNNRTDTVEGEGNEFSNKTINKKTANDSKIKTNISISTERPIFEFWLNTAGDSTEDTEEHEEELFSNSPQPTSKPEYVEVNVTGGRDHRLLQLLAQHMNFRFVYIEAPGRTQGTLRADGDLNESFTGGIGLLQNGLADILLGDVSLSWERRRAIEFSFFTLADSGAFATHAPRRLNEAFAILRPFKMDVWPYLILTVLFSGPIFYAIIVMPHKWQDSWRRRHDRHHLRNGRIVLLHDQQKGNKQQEAGKGQSFHMTYIREITVCKTTLTARQRWQHWMMEEYGDVEAGIGHHGIRGRRGQHELPPNLFDRCIWFTVQLFLKQSCQELYHGYRAKFLMIVYWISATYVLADVYAAQLTSQFARPPHEAPLNTLQALQRVMIEDGYKLYVEKESASLEMLENGTEIFRQLFAMMKHQEMGVADEEGYLIDSMETGMRLIADGLENKAVLGGRETLYFNIQQFGYKTFQLSQKLYTRYSAVGVQVGCPFLDSLNDVLIHLFEGGILEKMTNAEYETQARINRQEIMESKKQETAGVTPNPGGDLKDTATPTGVEDLKPPSSSGSGTGGVGSEVNEKGLDDATQQRTVEMQIIQPLNLRMLQGAFIGLFVGYATAGLILLLELLCHRMNSNWNAPPLRPLLSSIVGQIAGWCGGLYCWLRRWTLRWRQQQR